MKIQLSRREVLISTFISLIIFSLMITTLVYYVKAKILKTRINSVRNVTAVEAADWEEV